MRVSNAGLFEMYSINDNQKLNAKGGTSMRPRFYYLKSFIRFALSRTPLKVFSKSEIYKYTLERVSRLHYDQVAGYYSQSGQDHFIDTFVLNRKTNGVFVDVGANDGVNLSNSYYFEEKRGWTGLCVEPNPLLFNLLVLNQAKLD